MPQSYETRNVVSLSKDCKYKDLTNDPLKKHLSYLVAVHYGAEDNLEAKVIGLVKKSDIITNGKCMKQHIPKYFEQQDSNDYNTMLFGAFKNLLNKAIEELSDDNEKTKAKQHIAPYITSLPAFFTIFTEPVDGDHQYYGSNIEKSTLGVKPCEIEVTKKSDYDAIITTLKDTEMDLDDTLKIELDKIKSSLIKEEGQ